MTYHADTTGETTIIEVRPNRGGFAYFEVAPIWYSKYGNRRKIEPTYVVRLRGSASYFTKHRNYNAAFCAALRRAQAFDDGGASLQSRRILERRRVAK